MITRYSTSHVYALKYLSFHCDIVITNEPSPILVSDRFVCIVYLSHTDPQQTFFSVHHFAHQSVPATLLRTHSESVLHRLHHLCPTYPTVIAYPSPLIS